MREILFRGKCTDNGEWVEGLLFTVELDTYSEVEKKKYTHCIVEPKVEMYRGEIGNFEFVKPETVGQYTGFEDTNCKRIFEGDIVDFLGCKHQVIFEQGTFGLAYNIDWETIEKQIPIITGCDNDLCACLNDDYISLWEIFWNLENSHEVLDTVKIIGNIHDNPELLEGQN